MCTVILLRRPGHRWPVLIAANRDERLDRPADPPGHWWPDQPGVVGGRDRDGGGSWMAVNRGGVVATVLNRPGSLGPAPGKQSRGVLPLLAAQAATATAAAARIAALPAAEWREFNMVLADRDAAFFIRGLGHGRPEAVPLAAGVSMVTALDPNDLSSPRTARHLPRFQTAAPPEPDSGDWASWATLLADADTSGDPSAPRGAALNVPPQGGFGTVSSSLLALGAAGQVLWHFADGSPDRVPFRLVAV